MKHDSEFRQLIRTLPPTQQTLDFDDVNPWQSLPDADRQACCEAIAAMLTHIATTTCRHSQTTESNVTTERTGEQT